MIRYKKYNPDLHAGRLEMFSDGVFAIAITLLILEIKLPHHEDLERYGSLYNYLMHLWPSYTAYIVSFMVIGIYWSNHHWLFSFVKKTNHVFNLLNIVFLMTVAFIPFPTAILGEYFMEPAHRSAAVTVYSLGYLLPVLSTTAVVLCAKYGGLYKPGLSPAFINRLVAKLFLGMAIMIIALALSFNYPVATLCIIGATLVMYLFPPETPVYEDGGMEEM